MGNINKSRLLYIRHILETETDENHPMTVKEIIMKLANLGIKADRRNIAVDIELLQEFGIDIISSNERPMQYFIGQRLLEPPELKLLIDAVQASPFITERKSRQLSERLSSMMSKYQAESLRRHLYADKVIKSRNEEILYIVDRINTAINSGVQVNFQYTEYTPEKEKILKHGGQIYHVSPYGLWWNHDRYYLIGYCSHHQKITTFRAERIEHIKLTEEEAVPAPKGFDVPDFAKQRFHMFDMPPCKIVLECDNEVMKHIIDRFGEEVETKISDITHFIAEIKTAPNPPFYAWVFQFAGKIKILSPDEIKDEYADMVNIAMRH